MLVCPHCGAANSPGVVFCVRCQTNVHYHKLIPAQPERQLSLDQSKLRSEIERMNGLMVFCASVALIVGLFVLLHFISFSQTPDGGFVGMAWMFAWFVWVPFIFFPAVGVYMAWDRRRKLTGRFRELGRKDNDNAGESPRHSLLERCSNCGAEVMFVTSKCPNCQKEDVNHDAAC